MKILSIRVLLVILVISFSSAFAQVGLKKLGQSTMNFQLVSTSSRASGMGDAYFAVGDGAESVFYNPAGLSIGIYNFDLNISYTKWIADINYLTAIAAYNMDNLGVFAVSLLTVDYGTIHGTRLVDPSLMGSDPQGYIDTGDLSNIGAYSVGLSYSKAISTQFSVGGNVRYIGQNLGTSTFIGGSQKENSINKLVFDAGVKYLTDFKDFRFGMAVRNFGTSIKREVVEEQLPLTFTIGTAINLYKFIDEQDENQALTFALDFQQSNSYTERFNLGMEYIYMKTFSVRAGYQTNKDLVSWSGGFGLNTNILNSEVELNYSFSKMEVFDSINRLSVNFKL